MKRLAVCIAVLLGAVFCLAGNAADFTGDGTNNIGIFRDSTGLWAIRDVTRVYYGSSGDEPSPGDYNGDGTVDIGLFRPSSGLWAVKDITRVYFGSSTDEPLAGILASGGGGSVWTVSGSDIYRPSGNVGIGVDPFNTLDVAGNAVIGSTYAAAGYGPADGLLVEGQVGIGTSSPVDDAALEVSGPKAFLVPRLSTATRNALTPVNGMIIYNSTTEQFNFYENGSWVTK